MFDLRHRYFLPSFESTGISVQEKKFKIAVQDNGGRGGRFGFPIGTILVIFFLSASNPDTSY